MFRVFNIKGIAQRTGIAYDRMTNAFKFDSFKRLQRSEKNQIIEAIEKELEQLKERFKTND